ncbi:MAG: hypothetical protein WDN28_01140 [Chthoniobacter sp.]
MKASIRQEEWQRNANWWARGAALLMLATAGTHFPSLMASEEIPVRLPLPAPALRTGGLPFTAWDVVQYFSTVLEMSAEKGNAGVLFFENQQATQPEDRWRIEIWTEGRSVLVEFRAGGDYGLSLAREFFESPLFERDESEQLYELLSHAQNNPLRKLRRFSVGMTYKEMVDEQVLLLKFAALHPA